MKNKTRIFLYILFALIISSALLYLHRRYTGTSPKFTQENEPKFETFKHFEFSGDECLKGWKNKIFKGKSTYWIDSTELGNFLHAKSEKTSSAFYYMISYNIKDYPILSWEWRPIKFPGKTDNGDPIKSDDYALRIYVVFASGFFTNFKCIEYVWDESLKEGTKKVSPYSDKIMQLVVRSGAAATEWTSERRDVYEDYKHLFGSEPVLKVRAIAVMTDSEGSGTSSEGGIREIKIMKQI